MRKSARRFAFSFAIAMPAGLRSQTPMNQTASKPKAAMASHSADGTELKSTSLPALVLSSLSHTQVLISYKVGYRGKVAMLRLLVSLKSVASLRVFLSLMPPHVDRISTVLRTNHVRSD